MRTFLFKTLIFFFPIIIGFVLLIYKFADGYLDPFYSRFTSPKQSSLVLGSSRAAQGILPSVLNNEINSDSFEGPFYNFAFTIAHTPYGPYYLNAIKKKLKHETTNGIFILSVEPWGLSEKINVKGSIFEERNLPPGNMYTVNMNPNIEYILWNYNKPFRMMMNSPDTTTFLHEDGWLEISVTMNNKNVEKRTRNKILEYSKKMKEVKPSKVRMEYLKETIDFLKSKGKVYLVRIPCGNEIRKIEEKFWRDFSLEMRKISKSNGVAYFDFSKNFENYQMVDGNHLYKRDAKLFSQQLLDSLIYDRNKR